MDDEEWMDIFLDAPFPDPKTGTGAGVAPGMVGAVQPPAETTRWTWILPVDDLLETWAVAQVLLRSGDPLVLAFVPGSLPAEAAYRTLLLYDRTWEERRAVSWLTAEPAETPPRDPGTYALRVAGCLARERPNGVTVVARRLGQEDFRCLQASSERAGAGIGRRVVIRVPESGRWLRLARHHRGQALMPLFRYCADPLGACQQDCPRCLAALDGWGRPGNSPQDRLRRLEEDRNRQLRASAESRRLQPCPASGGARVASRGGVDLDPTLVEPLRLPGHPDTRPRRRAARAPHHERRRSLLSALLEARSEPGD